MSETTLNSGYSGKDALRLMWNKYKKNVSRSVITWEMYSMGMFPQMTSLFPNKRKTSDPVKWGDINPESKWVTGYSYKNGNPKYMINPTGLEELERRIQKRSEEHAYKRPEKTEQASNEVKGQGIYIEPEVKELYPHFAGIMNVVSDLTKELSNAKAKIQDLEEALEDAEIKIRDLERKNADLESEKKELIRLGQKAPYRETIDEMFDVLFQYADKFKE